MNEDQSAFVGRRRRDGGPRTSAGKAASSANALSTGIACKRLFDAGEQAAYEQLLGELQAEYALPGATARLQIEELAMVKVKLDRLDRVEAAGFQKARLANEQLARERREAAAQAPQAPQALQRAAQYALVDVAAAMPEFDRLDLLHRYQNRLQRQFCRLIEDLQRQQDRHRAKLAQTPAPGTRSGPPDITDVTDVTDVTGVKPRAAHERH